MNKSEKQSEAFQLAKHYVRLKDDSIYQPEALISEIAKDFYKKWKKLEELELVPTVNSEALMLHLRVKLTPEEGTQRLEAFLRIDDNFRDPINFSFGVYLKSKSKYWGQWGWRHELEWFRDKTKYKRLGKTGFIEKYSDEMLKQYVQKEVALRAHQGRVIPHQKIEIPGLGSLIEQYELDQVTRPQKGLNSVSSTTQKQGALKVKRL